MDLLKDYNLKINKFPNNKIDFVFNDYHSKQTNNGYSRKPLNGCFFNHWEKSIINELI
jgi:hypothetical protein